MRPPLTSIVALLTQAGQILRVKIQFNEISDFITEQFSLKDGRIFEKVSTVAVIYKLFLSSS